MPKSSVQSKGNARPLGILGVSLALSAEPISPFRISAAQPIEPNEPNRINVGLAGSFLISPPLASDFGLFVQATTLTLTPPPGRRKEKNEEEEKERKTPCCRCAGKKPRQPLAHPVPSRLVL
jgi:hypothetical protein